jgi:hypothetical protein
MVIQLSNKSTEELKKEITESNLIPKNTICDFEVLEQVTMGSKTYFTEEKLSKAENPMLVLVLRVYHDKGEKVIIDYLTANNPRMEFKLRHAMSSCGVSVADAKHFIGKAGKCKIGIQKSEDAQYADKNTILDYIEKGVAVEIPLDDEIPNFDKK